MKNAQEFWDKAAKGYAKSPISDMDSYNYTMGRTRSYLSPDDEILELGCGTGSTALLLAENVKRVTAIDISANMIDIGQQKALEQNVTNVGFVAADLFEDAFENAPFDAVLALNLLHLIEDIPAAVGRIHQLVKPGGLFISKTICQPEERGSFKFWMMNAILPVMQMVGMAPLVNFVKISALEAIITAQGFEILEAGNYPASPPCRYVVARRI